MAKVPVASIDLKQHDVSPDRGFLPDPDPTRALPGPLALWQELAGELPKRLAAGRVRSAVRTLPRFDLAALREPAEERAAMRALSFLGHAYVWEGGAPDPVLPQRLAAPWCALAPTATRYAWDGSGDWSELGAQAVLPPPVDRYLRSAVPMQVAADPSPTEIARLQALGYLEVGKP